MSIINPFDKTPLIPLKVAFRPEGLWIVCYIMTIESGPDQQEVGRISRHLCDERRDLWERFKDLMSEGGKYVHRTGDWARHRIRRRNRAGCHSAGDEGGEALITITVFGTPGPQGSKRFVGTKGGKGIMLESSKKVKPWREAVKTAALEASLFVALQASAGTRSIFDEPLYVRMVFTFHRPRGHYRSGKNAHLLRDAAPARPHGKPDLSKLARSTEDALTDAGIWRDDSRVVEYLRLAKVYSNEDPEALDAPGVRIEIRTRQEEGTA